MGFLESWRAATLCIDALARYGVDADSEIVSRVCKYTCAALASGQASGGLNWLIRRSAAITALCILGPDQFRLLNSDCHGVAIEHTIGQAAAAFSRGGTHAASLELQLIHVVSDAGRLHSAFAGEFSRLLVANLQPGRSHT